MATHSDVCEKETEVLYIIELIFVFKMLSVISMDVDQMVTRPIQFQSVLNFWIFFMVYFKARLQNNGVKNLYIIL
jgi:hypothetical protein